MNKHHPVPVDNTDKTAISLSAHYLARLHVAVQATGMRTRYMPADSQTVPRLEVINPKVTRLTETVFASPRNDNSSAWSYWFSWGDEICPATRPYEAATRLADLLTAKE